MSDQPKVHAWASAFTFSNGGTSLALTVAPDEAQAAAAAMHVLMQNTPALTGPGVGLQSALTIRVEDEWLRNAYRAVIEGQQAAAPVLSLVPKGAESEQPRVGGWVSREDAAEIALRQTRELDSRETPTDMTQIIGPAPGLGTSGGPAWRGPGESVNDLQNRTAPILPDDGVIGGNADRRLARELAGRPAHAFVIETGLCIKCGLHRDHAPLACEVA